jgi:hypothetical protein
VPPPEFTYRYPIENRSSPVLLKTKKIVHF